MSAAVGTAISLESKPRPMEMPLQFVPAELDTLPEPSMMMSEACSICWAMLWKALPEQSDTEMLPATDCRLLTSSWVPSVPAMVPLVTEPGALGAKVMSAACTLMESDCQPMDRLRLSSDGLPFTNVPPAW